MTDAHTTMPSASRASRWKHLSRRERAFALYLVMRRRWRDHDTPALTLYDTDTDVLAVGFNTLDPRGTFTIAVVEWDADKTLAVIEAEFGGEARAWAEATIAGGSR